MFTTQFGRIFWKEYRAQRTLWAILLGSGIAYIVAINVLVMDTHPHADWLLNAPMLLPVFYALAAGAMLFALERECRTSEWLLTLSASPKAILCAKIASVIVGALSLQVALLVILLSVRGGVTIADIAESRWMAFNPTGLLILVWCLFGSLVSRRAIVAVGATIACFALTIVLPIVTTLELYKLFYGYIDGTQYGYWFVGPILVLSCLIFLVGDIFIGWRWCEGKYIDGSIVERFCNRIQDWMGQHLRFETKIVRLPSRVEYGEPWRRTWQRLVWQERNRESIHIAILVAGCLFGSLAAIAEFRGGMGSIVILFVIFACIPMSMGVLAFETDTDHQQLRFLATRGISEVGLWAAKHFVWLPRAFWITGVVAVLPMVLAGFVATTLEAARYRNFIRDLNLTSAYENWSLIIWAILLGYSCGQLMSVVFRRTILAGVLAFIANAVAYLWMANLLRHYSTSFYYSPIFWWGLQLPIVLMLLFSLWQLKPRMYEDFSHSRHARIIIVIVCGAMILFICGVVHVNAAHFFSYSLAHFIN